MKNYKKYMKPKPKMDIYDRACNMLFFVICIVMVIKVDRSENPLLYYFCLCFSVWFLHNEIFYGGKKRK